MVRGVDDLRARILLTLINNTPPKYLAMPEDLSFLVTALIRELRLSVDRGVIIGCDGGCAVDECGCPNWKADDE